MLRKTPSLRLGLLGGWWNRDSDLPDLVIGGWRLPESVWKGLINVVLRRNRTAPLRREQAGAILKYAKGLEHPFQLLGSHQSHYKLS